MGKQRDTASHSSSVLTLFCGRATGHSQPQLFSSNPLLWATNGTQPATALQFQPSSVGEQRDTASHSSSVLTLFCGRATGHSQPQLFISNPLLWASNGTQPATALQFQPSSVGKQRDTASRSSSVLTLFCGRATGHSQPQLFISNPLLWASNGTQPATALQFQPSSVGDQRDTASRSSSVLTLFCGRATGHSQPQLFSSNPLLWASNGTQPAAALQFQPSSVGEQRDTASHSSSVPTLFCGQATGHSQPQLFSSDPLLWVSNRTQPAAALQFRPSSVGEQQDTASRSSSVPTLFCGRATGHSQPQLFSSNPLLWASNRTQPAAALQFQPSSVGEQQDTASRRSSVPTLFCGRATGHSQPQLFSSNPLLWASNGTQPATALQFQPSSVGEQRDTASHSSSVPTLFCGQATGHSQPQLFSSNPLLWATNGTQPAAALQFQLSSVDKQRDTASHSSSVLTLFCGRATGHSQPQLFSSNPLLWASNRTQPATALQFQPSSVGDQRDTASRSSSVPTLFCGQATGHSQPQLFSSNPLLWASNGTQPAAALQFQPSSVGEQRDTASHSSSVPTLFCG